MNFRRFSFTSEAVDLPATDEQLVSLYPSNPELEARCQQSLSGDRFVSLQSPVRPARNPLASLPLLGHGQGYDKSIEEVLEGLPAEYFTPGFDPVREHLEEISSWDRSELVERFMQKIEDTDADKDLVISHLTS
ncbi:hypothetical protein EON64_19960, partial [archaeon]